MQGERALFPRPEREEVRIGSYEELAGGAQGRSSSSVSEEPGASGSETRACAALIQVEECGGPGSNRLRGLPGQQRRGRATHRDGTPHSGARARRWGCGRR